MIGNQPAGCVVVAGNKKMTLNSMQIESSAFRGATDPIRTDDLLITSELLYQLSHSSICGTRYSIPIIPGFVKRFAENLLRKPGIFAFLPVPPGSFLPVSGVDGRQLRRGKRRILRRLHIIQNLRRLGGADEHRGDDSVPQHPGQRHLCQGLAP